MAKATTFGAESCGNGDQADMRVEDYQLESEDVQPLSPTPLFAQSLSRRSNGLDHLRALARRMTPALTPGQVKDAMSHTTTENSSDGRLERIFSDPEYMKIKVREKLLKKSYNVHDFYKTTGIWQSLARSSVFENITLMVISFNGIWFFFDTDYNPADVLLEAPVIFQIAEHFFCAFFLCEWIFRFMAFQRKCDGLKDPWFVFDSGLVMFSILDTWVMQIIVALSGSTDGGFNASILRLVRLLRLMRVARMARLLRAIPELLILVKGMAAATRTVLLTLFMVFVATYVFAIVLAQLSADTTSGTKYFSSVPHAMYSLMIYGTLVDSVGIILNDLCEDSYMLTTTMLVFILLSAMTLMNLLIGILCEVVSNVAKAERDEMSVALVTGKLFHILVECDEDSDGMISRDEFKQLLSNTEALEALTDVGVDPAALVDLSDVIFERGEDDEQSSNLLSFSAFMQLVLEMRGSNAATVRDVVILKKFVRQLTEDTNDQIEKSHELLAKVDARLEAFVDAAASAPGGLHDNQKAKVVSASLRRAGSGPYRPHRPICGSPPSRTVKESADERKHRDEACRPKCGTRSRSLDSFGFDTPVKSGQSADSEKSGTCSWRLRRPTRIEVKQEPTKASISVDALLSIADSDKSASSLTNHLNTLDADINEGFKELEKMLRKLPVGVDTHPCDLAEPVVRGRSAELPNVPRKISVNSRDPSDQGSTMGLRIISDALRLQMAGLQDTLSERVREFHRLLDNDGSKHVGSERELS
eukprot:TRINITY_DN8416_c0_g2_i1.p1 TRINITY_DN8416_c0_g2~~TRINITY_DN8416_c0_g2_i1.p1  ORF type:complete len:759 (+),score=81.46 TRINITY_DN8416_c0_g2_i1:53-2329(+)